MNVLGVLCNYKTFIKALDFMDEQQENKKSLWDSIRGLVDKNDEEKKEKEPNTLFSFWCKIAKDGIDEMDKDLEDAIIQKNELTQALLDLGVYYNQEKTQNKEKDYTISKLIADKRTLVEENKQLHQRITFLQENHKQQIEELEIRLKHQEARQKYPKVKSPST